MTTRAITARSRFWSGLLMNKKAFRAALLAVPYLLAVPALADAGETGEALFSSICAACHGDQGQGTAGIAPPLVDPTLWQGLGDKAPVYIAGVMAGGMSGKINANGVDYIGLVMPTQGLQQRASLAVDQLVGRVERQCAVDRLERTGGLTARGQHAGADSPRLRVGGRGNDCAHRGFVGPLVERLGAGAARVAGQIAAEIMGDDQVLAATQQMIQAGVDALQARFDTIRYRRRKAQAAS